jgi:hypothetical protein
LLDTFRAEVEAQKQRDEREAAEAARREDRRVADEAQREASRKQVETQMASAAAARRRPVAHDPQTGEVLEGKPRPRKLRRQPILPTRPFRVVTDEATGQRVRVELTVEEIQDRDAARAEGEMRRAEDRRALAEVIPVFRERIPALGELLIKGDARTLRGRELLVLDRPNGSKLRLVARHYDGTGISGTRDINYINAHVLFRKPGSGLPFRTRGVMFESGELREVARVLLEEADKLDALEGSADDLDVDYSRSMGEDEDA